MEEYRLERDIKVWYVSADSFPDGITEAHEKLHALLPTVRDRNFFGISYPDKDHGIIYKAAVEESFPGEAEKYDCETFVIRKGKYISEMITGWQKDPAKISETFQQLLSNGNIDKNGYCLEVYVGADDMRCMVGMAG